MSHALWKVLPAAPPSEKKTGNISPLLAQLLYNRGIRSADEIQAFLAADERLAGDPFLLPDMESAVNRIYRALLSGEKIVIYGDFDADGITATALLVEGLTSLGANVVSYIPHRLSEGYGVRIAALDNMRRDGISLVITCDSGIGAIREAQHARQTGIDMIITDHHLPLACLPEALAVINPKRKDSVYPFRELAGVGVAYKLIEAVCHGRHESTDKLKDLVALGTVADMSPLVGENRRLVKQGLVILNDTERPGLRELMRCAGVDVGDVRAETISWVIAPRLNAMGRLDRATASYDLLVTQSAEQAEILAQELEKNNTQRQRLTREVLARARDDVTETGLDHPVLISGDEDYPPGVVGIVAGKLVEEFYRPVFILKISDGVCRGSGRSIPEFNLMEALQACTDLLLEFGGHSGAAGFTLDSNNLSRFRDRLLEFASRQIGDIDLRPHLVIDAETTLRGLNWGVYNSIKQLEPIGSGNPQPVFLSRNVKVVDARRMGSHNEHLRLKLRDGNTTWPAVAFNFGCEEAQLTPYVDVVYSLDVDHWNGQDNLRLNLMDFTPSQP